MRRRTKLAALAVTAGVALAATGAYAYWTTTGSGSGSATVASANGTVTLHGHIDVVGTEAAPGHDPYPGGSNPVTFTADNAGATNLYVGTISLLAVGGVTVDEAHSGCSVADFSMASVPSNSIVSAGAEGQAITGLGSLVFANSNSNQNACKGATITLNLSSN